MENGSKVALFDMDGTLADYDGGMRDALLELAAPGEPTPLVSWDDDVTPAWLRARMRLIKSQVGWWRGLAELPIGFEILRAATRIGFDVHVLTKGPRTTPNAWTEKLQWCQDHLGSQVNLSITLDKSLTYGRVLVDYPPYMDAWLRHRPRGVGIMPAANYNANYRHPQVVRYDGDNIKEVVDALQKAFDR